MESVISGNSLDMSTRINSISFRTFTFPLPPGSFLNVDAFDSPGRDARKLEFAVVGLKNGQSATFHEGTSGEVPSFIMLEHEPLWNSQVAQKLLSTDCQDVSILCPTTTETA